MANDCESSIPLGGLGTCTRIIVVTPQDFGATKLNEALAHVAFSLRDPVSAHGLHKATGLAQIGCTEKQIAAIVSHATLKEVTRYTADTSRKRLARGWMAKLIKGGEGRGTVNKFLSSTGILLDNFGAKHLKNNEHKYENGRPDRTRTSLPAPYISAMMIVMIFTRAIG